MADPTPREEPTLTRLGGLLSAWEEDATAAHDARVRNIPRGPITDLPTIDRELGGALSPGLHIIHGSPGAGKTAFALQAAGRCCCPALVVTCEIAPLELFRRVTARVTGTYLGRLKSGEFTPAKSLELARRGAAECPNLAIVDSTCSFAGPKWLRSAAQTVRGDGKHLLIVVDSVHSWADAAQGDATEYEALNMALSQLRVLASTLNCPVLAVAERNRASMKAGGLSAGAGSRKIEYGAETVLDLDRDSEVRPDAAGEVPVALKFAKNRNGAAGEKVALRFHGALQQFREA